VDTFGVRQIPELKFPLKNIKDRQTYFGALDYQPQEFIQSIHVEIHQTLSSLLIIYKPSDLEKIALIWDGAGYHKSDEVKEFLASVNNHLPDQWQITCIIFAPNAPNRTR